MSIEIHYHYRGPIERRYSESVRWYDGYSANGVNGPLSPWDTKKVCRADAKKRGCKAVFFRDGKKER